MHFWRVALALVLCPLAGAHATPLNSSTDLTHTPLPSFNLTFTFATDISQTAPCNATGTTSPYASVTLTKDGHSIVASTIGPANMYGQSQDCLGRHSDSESFSVTGPSGPLTITFKSLAEWFRVPPGGGNASAASIVKSSHLTLTSGQATILDQDWSPVDPGPPSSGHQSASGGDVTSTIYVDLEPTPVSPPAPANALSTTAGVISAQSGGTLVTATIGLEVPKGTLGTDRVYRVSSIPTTLFNPVNTNDLPDGLALLVQTNAAPPAARKLTPRAQTSVKLTLSLPSGIPQEDTPLVQVVGFDGTAYPLYFPSTISGDTITVNIPGQIFASAKTIQLYFVRYGGAPDAAAGGRLLVGHNWMPNVNGFDPSKHTLILIHGILSTVEDAFPGSVAQRIGHEGGYDQVIGYTYDYWQPPSVAGAQFAAFVNGLNLSKSVDVVAHSYGGVVAMAAIPSFGLSVDNFVTLGSPLNGSPFLSEQLLTTIAANLPDRVGSIKHIGDALASGMLSVLIPNNSTLRSIQKQFNKAGVTRVIKIAGSNPFFWERSGAFSMLYSFLTGSTLPNVFDGVVTPDSATTGQVMASKNKSPFAVHAPVLSTSIQLALTHFELDKLTDADRAYVPLMFYSFSSDPFFLIKGNGAYSVAWWIDEDGLPSTITAAPADTSIVNVVPSRIGTIGPSQPPTGTMPNNHVEIVGGSTAGQTTISISDSDTNNHRLTKTVNRLPDCDGCSK